MTLEDCRQFYAGEVRLLAQVHSAALVNAFARVPRERFAGPAPWRIMSPEAGAAGPEYVATSDPADLYHNVLIALDASRGINNGQPSALARWIAALDLDENARVFHIGCGAGYYTAIMAEVAGPAGNVLAVDVDPSLAARARVNLQSYANVTVQCADGAAVDAGARDAIFVNAGITHPHPPWLRSLADRGRLVFPLTVTRSDRSFGSGVIVTIERRGAGFSAGIVGRVAIYSSASVRDAALEPTIRKALSIGAILKVKSVRLDPHEPDDRCVVHANGVCLTSGS